MASGGKHVEWLEKIKGIDVGLKEDQLLGDDAGKQKEVCEIYK